MQPSKWQCDDRETAVFQGYASPIEKADLERICGEAVQKVAETGSLPFTGFDLLAMLIVAALLLIGGAALHASSRTRGV